jgi:hypothetical protein
VLVMPAPILLADRNVPTTIQDVDDAANDMGPQDSLIGRENDLEEQVCHR